MTQYPKVFRRVELFVKSIVTVNKRCVFWCDSKIWLCLICGHMRGWIRNLKRPPSDLRLVLDRHNTLWVFAKTWVFPTPQHLKLGRNSVTFLRHSIVRRIESKKGGRIIIYDNRGNPLNHLLGC